MPPYFVTSNANKYAEAKRIIPDLEQIELDLPEIQHEDPKEIVRAKLEAAVKHHDHVFVEDVSFHLDALKGLPGPFVKFFIAKMGPQGLYDIAHGLGNYNAEAVCTIGYAKDGQMHFFEGSVKGKVVPEGGPEYFSFDRVFVPEGHDKRFSEMAPEEKNKISHRALALQKLIAFING